MKYLCLAYEEESKLKQLNEEQWLALRRETLDYVGELQQRQILISTNALQSATKARTLKIRDNELSVSDGPFAETKEQIGGFFLIVANSIDEAVNIASRWPSARLGTIEVRPVEEELRMDSRY